jgi:hypothetical protein
LFKDIKGNILEGVFLATPNLRFVVGAWQKDSHKLSYRSHLLVLDGHQYFLFVLVLLDWAVMDSIVLRTNAVLNAVWLSGKTKLRCENINDFFIVYLSANIKAFLESVIEVIGDIFLNCSGHSIMVLTDT